MEDREFLEKLADALIEIDDQANGKLKDIDDERWIDDLAAIVFNDTKGVKYNEIRHFPDISLN